MTEGKGAVNHVKSVDEFDKILSDNKSKLVAVDFFAEWCGPCKKIAPDVVKLAEKYAGSVVFIKVDVDEAEKLAERQAITAMPTFQFFKNGEKILEFQGANLQKLTETVEKNK